MNKTYKLLSCFLFLMLLNMNIKAQMAGVYNIPGDFPTVAAATSSLNSVGVNGPVTINIPAGYTETLTSVISLSATGTSANPITFQKSGAGSNPMLVAYAGGVGTPGTAAQDGLFRLVGSDYITIDGLDLMDPNGSNPATMEYGYGLFKASATDGCQNVTIKNCTVTLNRTNNATGTSPATDGSRGIDMVDALPTAHTSVVTITAASGTNSNNKFYSNTLQNCNIGIALIGYAASSPFTNADTGNDIGGSSSATGNTIVNYGGAAAATNPAAAVRTLAQYNLNVSYNTVNNNNGAGANHVTVLRGLYVNTAASANASINNNTITVNSGATTSNLTAIENASGSTAAGNAITISNNMISGCTYSTATSGVFTGILSSASAATLNITNNMFSGNSTAATSGTHLLISNTGAVTSALNINANAVNGFSFTSASGGTFNEFSNSGGASTSALSISSNTIQGVTHALAATTTHNFILNTATTGSQTINSNVFVNLALNTTGSITFIGNNVSLPATGTQSVSNNSIVTAFNKNGAGGTVTLFTSNASSSAGSIVSQISNNFSNITLTGATTMAGWSNTDGGSPAKTISSNVFSNWTCGSSAVTVINSNYGGNGTSVSSNTISGITGTGAITGVSFGSSNGGAAQSFTGNVISGLNGGGAVVGFSGGSSSITSLNINNNIISGFSTTAASSAIGVNLTGGATVNVFANKIYDIQSNNASGTASGIILASGTTVNTYNNLVGDIRTPSSNLATPLTGISITGGSTHNVYFNSVNLNATSAGALFGSAAILSSSTPSVNLRNNIFVNTSTPSGAGLTVAYQRSSATLTTYSSTSNNNLFYAGTPSANHVIFYDGTTSQQTIGAFKTLVSPRDVASVSENPPFVSTTGSNPNFLNIMTSTPTQIESGGAPITGITTDYAGTVRNVSTPDIGAWEGSYTLADLTPPAITAVGYASSGCSLSARTVTANLSDASGVATGTLAPRVYYKVNAAPYTSVQGTLISGTVNNGVWSFGLTYAASISDVISYYVVAQDAASASNLGANPSAGFAGTDVNTVSSPPTTPLTYTIAAVLSGVYTVGATGTFTTLTAAANAYNTSCLSGAVTFQLIDPLYSSAETFPITFLNNSDASSTNSLLIVPNTGVSAVVTATSSATAVVKFLNARFITMDGLNSGGSSLTLNSTSTSTTANIWMASTSATGPGCNTIGLKNMTLNGGSNTATQFGIVAGIDGAVPSATGGQDIDNVTITGNTILKNYYGIFASGTTSVTAGGLDNWTVNTNTIGPVTSGTNTIGFAGIYVQNMLNLTVNSNLVQNIITASSANGGIYLASGVNTAAVSQNTVNMITTNSTSSSGSSSTSGIFFGLNVINSSISKNIVSSIYNTSTNGYGARGIMLSTGVTLSNDVIQNNMISDIVSYSDPLTAYWPIGIGLEAASGGISIDYNTVSLSGSHPGLTSATGAAPLYINTGTTAGLSIRDNIFSNTYDNSSSTTDIDYSIYSTSAIGSFSVMNYNDYYVGGSASSLVLGYLGGNQTTLVAIQASFGGNLNSQNTAPVFTSVTDLHLVPASNVALDNTGTPIAGITTDIDGQTRSTTTPDMGADEFLAPVCTSANAGTQASTSFSACNGQTVALSSSGASTGIGITYQWMVSSTPSGPYSNVTGGSGATTVSYTTAPLSTGAYYFVLQTTCSSASLTGTSNEATVTINPIPIASISSNAPICSGQNLNLTGGTDIGTSFVWTGPNSYSSTTQNPTITGASPAASGIYTLIVATSNCTAVAVTSSLTVNATPTSLTVTPTFTTFCAGGSQSITVSGGLIPATMNFGTNTNTNTATTYPAPYSIYWGGQRMQFLVLASELSAAGFVTNSPFNSLAFPVVSKAANWGVTTFDDKNFQVSVGSTSLTSLTSFQTGLTNVLAPANFTPVVGYNNVHNFSTPFVWDGVSNVIFETTFSNNVAGTVSDAVFQYTTATSFTSTIVYRADNTTAAAIAAGTTVNEGPFMARPDFKLNGLSTGTYSWSPSSSLSSSTGTAVVATPSVPTVYSVTVANGSCASNAAASVSVVPVPTVAIAASPTLACSGSSVTLIASGATSYTWTTGSNSATITPTPSANVTYTVRGANGPCFSLAVQSISVVPGPTVTAASSTSLLCTGQTATLTGGGSATSYSWSTGATTTVIAVSPSVTTTYTLTGTNGTCSSVAMITQSVSTCTGIDELTASGVSIYPNPNNGFVTISIPSSLAASSTIEVVDAIGKLILKESLTRATTTLNLSQFDNGVYIYKLSSNGEIISIGRLIKQ